MSAIREVKYLRELKHQNVIEACMTSWTNYFLAHFQLWYTAAGRFLFENESEPCPRIPRFWLGNGHQGPIPCFPPGWY
jgi:hypothetical protein